MFSTSLKVKLTFDGAGSTPAGAAVTVVRGSLETSSNSSSDHVIANAASSAGSAAAAGTGGTETGGTGTGCAGTGGVGTGSAMGGEDGEDGAERDVAESADALCR